MPLRTTNRDMGNLIRGKRRNLNEYMYNGPAPEDAEVDLPPPTDLMDLEDEEIVPGDEPPMAAVDALAADETETGAIVVKAPGEEAEPDMFTYEQGPGGGWMVYPPGVPCPGDTYKCQLDHPAGEDDFLAMEEALDAAGALNEETGY